MNHAVLDWLLDSDPAVRWQVLADLVRAPTADVAAARARVATEGMGARLLALQGDDGAWSGVAWNRGWNSTMHVLTLLREFGLDPGCREARAALGRVREQVTWRGCGPDEVAHHRFFEGETEPCINGQVAAAGAYFREDVESLIARLVAEQLADGGWNCEAERGSTRSSFNTTVCVLEALLEYELAGGADTAARAARLRGQDYLLERNLFRRKSTGEPILTDRKGGASWMRFAFPTGWHYDLLRALEHLRRAGTAPDERAAEAVALLEARRAADGRWSRDTEYPGVMPVQLDEGPGLPSRWITLRAMRVLDWYHGGV